MEGKTEQLGSTYNTGKLNLPRFDQASGTMKSTKALSHWSRFEKFLQTNFPNRSPSNEKQTESAYSITNSEHKKFKKPNSAKSYYEITDEQLLQMRRDSLPLNNMPNYENSNPLPIDSPLNEELDDEKLLLRGFQTIEALDKVLANPSQKFSELNMQHLLPTLRRVPLDTQLSLSCEQLEKLAYHRAKLKNLLEERCYIGLRRECCLHLNQLVNFVLELEALSKDQNYKVKLHSLGVNKSIGDIYFGRKKTYLDDLDKFVCRWPSIIHKINRMLGVFHMEWDAKVEFLLKNSEIDSNKLLVRAFGWTRSVLNFDLIILSSKDQQTIPSEIIENYYKNVETFHDILIKQSITDQNMGSYHCECKENMLSCSACYLQSFSSLTSISVIEVLAKHQGEKAAGNILDTLTAEWRNCDILNTHTRVNWLENVSNLCSTQGNSSVIASNYNLPSTSDYFTNSEITNSEIEVNSKESVTEFNEFNGNSSSSKSFDLKDILANIIQNNQSSLLKHLFARARIETMPASNKNIQNTLQRIKSTNNQLNHSNVSRKGKHNYAKNKAPSRSVWSVYKPKRTRSESSSHLERIFWRCFWKTVNDTLLKLSQFSSGKIQKNSRMGTFHFLPQTFALFVQSKTKELMPNADLCTDAFVCMRNFSYKLFEIGSLSTWDQQFCSFTSLTNHQCDSTVFLLNDCYGTLGGKTLSNCLETAIALSGVMESMNYPINLAKAITILQCSVDCFINWGRTKQYNLISFGNVPLYITVGLSDLNRMTELLDCLHFSPSLLPFGFESFWCLPAQKCSLQSLIENMPKIIYMQVYKEAKEKVEEGMPKVRYWRRKKKVSKLISTYKELLMMEVLDPKITAIARVSECQVRLQTIKKLGDAVAYSWMAYFLSKRNNIKFSPIGVVQFRNDFEDIVKWLGNSEDSSLTKPNEQIVRKLILESEGFKKIKETIKYLATIALVLGPKPLSGRNRVHPLPIDSQEIIEIVSYSSIELSENEKESWKHLLLTTNQQTWPNLLLASYLTCCS